MNKVSILARKLTSVYATITTKMEFQPEIHQHSAGIIMYYDNMNYINHRHYADFDFFEYKADEKAAVR